jgi:outer membrane immunogenic protein
MRKLFGTAALLTAFATSAMAADVAVRAPARYVAPVAVYNWTGFYVGIEGGGGWGFARQRDALGFNSGGYNVSGGLVGGTLGYNWQINRLVLGLEADEWPIYGARQTLSSAAALPRTARRICGRSARFVDASAGPACCGGIT